MAQQQFDPLQALRDLLDNAERRLNEVLSEWSAREDMSALRARISDATLETQKRAWEMWARYFQAINLPTRTDIIRLGKRLAEIEQSLARIEAQLRGLERAGSSSEGRPLSPGVGPERPRRTRRPPGAAQDAIRERR